MINTVILGESQESTSPHPVILGESRESTDAEHGLIPGSPACAEDDSMGAEDDSMGAEDDGVGPGLTVWDRG